MQFTWPTNDEQTLHYYDNEWETPLNDDKKHFEFIVLDSFQASLNWKTILHRQKHLQYFFYLFHLKSHELKLV